MPWIYAHLIGDFLLQNDKMSLNKKTSSCWCLLHVAIYLLPFLACGLQWWQLAMIGLQHYWQDRTNVTVSLMKWKGSSQFATGTCALWSIIVTDQILHILFIALVVSG